MWDCPDRRPSGPAFLGKSQTGTGTTEFGLVQTRSQLVWDRTSPTLLTEAGPKGSEVGPLGQDIRDQGKVSETGGE